MALQWNRTIGEVLGQETQEIEKVSEKNQKTYKAVIIPLYKAQIIKVDEVEYDGVVTYSYTVMDPVINEVFAIKTPNLVSFTPMETVGFKNLWGGPTNNGSWFKADSIVVSKKAGE